MLYLGDSSEAISSVPDASIKLVYGSPPYPNAKRDYGAWTGDEWITMMKRHMSAFVPKLQNDGFIAINVKACREDAPKGGNSFRRRWVERFLIWVEDTLPLYAVDDEVWYKECPAPTGLRASAQDAWESIFVWAKSNPWEWNMDAIRRPYAQGTFERYQSSYKPLRNGVGYHSKEKKVEANPLGALPINVVCGGGAPKIDNEFLHQARQPEYLPERYISAYTNRGDLVWDPWMGSGTTLTVAQRLGRRFGGSDVLEKNVIMVKKRLYPAF